MSNHRLMSISHVINKKEYDRLSKILIHYNIKPEDIERIRSVYKVKVEDKYYCLKNIKSSNSNALKGMLLTDYLLEKSFDNLALFYKAEDGRQCVRSGSRLYYLTQWIQGFECDFNDFEELKKATLLLADFHVKAKGFYNRDVKIRSNFKNWPEKFIELKKDIIIFKKIIENKKVKTNFDISYLNSSDKFELLIDKAIDLLNKSNYYNVSNKAKMNRTLCHDSFYYQNVLKDENNKLFLIDLDSTIYDIHTYDLAKFIRRILYKKNYAWDFNIAKELIDTYSSVNPLLLEDYEILLAFLVFPHKFWKLGKKRYIKRKKWNEEKYLRKLDKLIKYEDRQYEFINKFIEFYEIEKGE